MGLEVGAKIVVSTCLRIREGELVLTIADVGREAIGRALFAASKEIGAEPVIAIINERKRAGEEPPKHVVESLKESDVVIFATSHSMTHTRARRIASKAGARTASLPGVTEQMMSSGALTADYLKIKEKMDSIAARVRASKEVHVTTSSGSDFSFSSEGRRWITEDTGLCHRKGETTTLPAGEIFLAPLEGTAEGRIVIERFFGEPEGHRVTIQLEDGYATKIVGAKHVVQVMNRGGREGRNLAKFGLGLNPKATLSNILLEEEKVLGAAHIAFGDNSAFGGRVHCGVRVDAILPSVSVEVDGKSLVEQGSLA